jgi:3'-phosphoadenosine 5'-phosphosulfate sulfotransferase (PAPS reductase)/FAD synthetase
MEKVSEELVVLSFGGGQDSTAILYKCVFDADFMQKYIGNKTILVIFCDTGNEYPETYDYLRDIIVPFCELYEIQFEWLKPDRGFHPNTWQSLQGQFKKNDSVMSVAFPKTCTDNLKVKPFYNYLGSVLGDKSKVVNFYNYHKKYGKLTVMIGIARGEEKRAKCSKQLSLFPLDDKDPTIPVYRQKTVEIQYPLIEIGYNRADCQAYIESVGLPVPPPSNCMFCPFQNEKEVLLLSMKYQDKFKEWIDYEYAKMVKYIDLPTDKNYGVKGRYTLPEYLQRAKLKYPNETIESLEHYRFSHGHSTKSKF